MILTTIVNDVRVEIDLHGVTESIYRSTASLLSDALSRKGVKNRDAIREAFLFVLQQSPGANASDLWHHIVYRLYCEILPQHRSQDPKQSWVRAGGEALELAVERLYAPVLDPHGIEMEALIGATKKDDALRAMGIEGIVGKGKLDVALHVAIHDDLWTIFGGVHVKASLAERVSDDVPASRAMMDRGYFSPLWTLDVKSFPPPHGDLVNRGELGTPESPSEKRKYIEEHGEFDGCYSANSRSVASGGATRSGKRIFTLELLRQPDHFAKHVITRGVEFRRAALKKR